MAATEGGVGNANVSNFDELDLESSSIIDKEDNEEKDVVESEDIKYLLKNCYVPLDNGKNGLVFSADYTQREPRYTCYVCSARMHGVKEFNMHTASQNHCTEMGKYKYPAKNFPILLGDTETEIELGEPAPPGMENEIQIKPCKIQPTLDLFRTLPLIGLEYLIELTDGWDVMAYCCLLCDNQKIRRNSLQGYFCCEPNPHVILKHLTSGPHSLKYLSLYFPRAYKAFEILPKCNDGTGIILNRVLKRIEGKFGRLKPRPFINRDFGQGKAALLKSIQEAFHFRESPEDEFDKMTKPDFETSAHKGGSKDKIGDSKNFNPIIFMKGRKFGVINTKSNNFGPAKSDENPTTESGESSVNKDKKDDSDTGKDDRELNNLSPVSGGSMGSMRGSRSRSNSPPRGNDRRSPDRSRHWAGNRSTSRNRTRSPRSRNRSRSGDRSRSHNRSRSPRQHYRPRYTRGGGGGGYKSRSRSRDRLNLPYRHKRSYSRSRSRSPRSFNRGRYNKFQPRRSPDEDQYKSDRFKEELRVLLDKLKYHEKYPEKHPQYSVEWKEFWNRRYKELQTDGKDPTKHDFKPEWIAYWKERMLELHDQDALALKERIYNPVNEKPSDETQEANAPTKDPPGARMGFIPFSDDSSKVISVLRLITVLESMLGVLAPQVVTLLSKALTMEKAKPDSSEDILYNESDCMLLETVKEKLKGLFFAGLVERHLVNTTKYTIKSIEEVLSKAPKSFGKRTNPPPTLVKPSNSTVVPPSKPVTVSGIGTVDRSAIAQQIATALISQGRTDVSEQELESLIDAVVASSAEEQAPPPASTSQPQPQPQSQAQPSGALTMLQSAYNEGVTASNSDILYKTLPLIESVDIIASLTDYDLRVLVQNFNVLTPLNQSKVINYVKAVEKTDPIRLQRFQQLNSVNLNNLMAQAGSIPPLSTRTDNFNPGGSNVVTMGDGANNYNYQDFHRTAPQMMGNNQMAPNQPPYPPFPPYTNNAWWPQY